MDSIKKEVYLTLVITFLVAMEYKINILLDLH